MDNELLYIIVLVIGLIVIVFSIFSRSKPKTLQQKRKEILKGYEKEIKDALKDLEEYEIEERMTRKRLLIKRFNDELSRNIYFENHEIRDILAELSRI